MANTTQKKTTTRATNAKGTTKTPVAKKVEEEVVTEPKVEYVPVKKQEVDMNQTITVRNGFHGILVYKSRRTGEEYVWNEFGDEQDMELSELKNIFGFDSIVIYDSQGTERVSDGSVWNVSFPIDPEDAAYALNNLRYGRSGVFLDPHENVGNPGVYGNARETSRGV